VEKLFDFDFHKLQNMTNVCVQNLCFYRARFSIQGPFKTTPCPLASDSATNIPWAGAEPSPESFQ